jgi:hypothetical protein
MRYLSLLVVLALVGCDAGSAPLGEPVLQVIGGDGQTTSAPRDTLDAPVVAQLGRQRSGGITFRLVRDLHAQTSVVGIAGEQVCAVGITDNPLIPWNPCATTNADGMATFFFDPGTQAGIAMAEIRAVVDGQKVVTDTATAVVEPGPPVSVIWANPSRLPVDVVPGDTLDLSALKIDGGRDEHGNTTTVAAVVQTLSAATLWQPVAAGGQLCQPSDAREPDQQGWSTVVPAEAAGWPASAYEGYNACMFLWIDGTRTGGDAMRVR